MELLTIGAFARASRLSPKALRLYDEQGLLCPADVDPHSGYRLYAPDQLERARLVARLRQLGMPLARIRVVCDAEPADAASEVADFWREVEDGAWSGKRLATFLVDHLSREDSVLIDDDRSPFELRCAMSYDGGLTRKSNEDRSFAGQRLFAVADGFGAADRGVDPASAIAVRALEPLESASAGDDPLHALDRAVSDADAAVRETLMSDRSDQLLENQLMGTTLTAMLWSGSGFALASVGDSRCYLLRDGELVQLTRDHTVVQTLVEDGSLAAEDADSHPKRPMLARALHGGGAAQHDLQLREARAGDRYLLCTDGLHQVVAAEKVRAVLGERAEPEAVVARFVELANEKGGPDNIACVVVDVELGC
jgi:protein phosphatase